MGIYIERTEKTHQEILNEWTKDGKAEHIGTRIGLQGAGVSDLIKEYDETLGNCLVVCLVDNMAFTALGVMTSHNEIRAFCGNNDMRPKYFFRVDKDAVIKLQPNLERLI